MKKCTKQTASPSSSAVLSLFEELAALGFTEGAPAHIAPAVLAIDRRAALSMRCPCGASSRWFHPYHRVREYRGVATCRRCLRCEEI